MSATFDHASLAKPSRTTIADLTLQGGERWYVVRTQAHRESLAMMQLGNLGLRTFMPRYRKTVRHARRLKESLAPLFPCYFFVILAVDRDRWHDVNSTAGVVSLLMSGDWPAAAPNGVVEGLIAGTSAGDAPRAARPDLVPGKKVRLIEGPFADRLGVLEYLDDKGRVRVLLEMLGAWRPVQMPHREVAPAS